MTEANAVYLSQYQLLPYERIRDHFTGPLGIPLSSGSVHNFIGEADELAQRTGALNKIMAVLKRSPS